MQIHSPGPGVLGAWPCRLTWGAESMSWRCSYSGQVHQVRLARHFAASLLAGTGCEDPAQFIVSELAANAIKHTRSGQPGGWFDLMITVGELVSVAVTDLGGDQIPTVRPQDLGTQQAEGGRGLLGISRLAVAVGVYGSIHDGHTVWADLDLEIDEPQPPHHPALATR